MTNNLVILTDLDGTLLDRNSFQPGPALKHLDECNRLKIPVVFVSGKSKAEIESIRKELHNESPFISENGGGLYIPVEQFPDLKGFSRDDKYWRWGADVSIDEMRKALFDIAAETGVKAKCFFEMSDEEAAKCTGLDLHRAKLAKQRDFDEPFILDNPPPDFIVVLRDEINKRGYRYTTGGQLHHIMGNFDKGHTVVLLKNIYFQVNPQMKFAALGDAYNDLEMLKQVDYPFLVRQANSSYAAEIVFDGLTITNGTGPSGFAEAVGSLIERFNPAV
ncbi:MAG: HAD-IIB family hydrolase [candidate division Zixibacteria bacterium]|nr:HAD-IIB family hydrolase [candidate division Zixibacteria bacterium]